MWVIEGKHFEKVFSLILPETINFAPDRALPVKPLVFTSCVERPIRGKILLKVFGKGVRGKNLSSERFFPDKSI